MWQSWSYAKFFAIMKKCLNDLASDSTFMTIKGQLEAIVLNSSNYQHLDNYFDYREKVFGVLKASGSMATNTRMTTKLSANEQALLATALYDKLPTNTPMNAAFKAVLKSKSQAAKGKFPTFEAFFKLCGYYYQERIGVLTKANEYRIPIANESEDEIFAGFTNTSSPTKVKVTPKQRCSGCGFFGLCRSKADCTYKVHPGFNNENLSWAESEKGRGYAANTPAKPGSPAGTPMGCDHIVFAFHHTGTKLTQAEKDAVMAAGFVHKLPPQKRQRV